ncbi:uncharacterized protein LOC110449746 [Mizuhopecten yessoensis]|uniref:uncharacterized protein LOC110449746 n=1 Tax=Mizuhopecten yessoensis TaxID=6573 RepID=UPI000B45BBF5|nr:uncharacterized protein LOC110449746 [Mizuhopecten yessoensis]
MGSLGSKENNSESKSTYTITKKRKGAKRPSKKQRKRNREALTNTNNESDTQFSKAHYREESDASSGKYWDCYTETPKEENNVPNAHLPEANYSEESDDESSGKYWDCYTDVPKERNNASKTEISDQNSNNKRDEESSENKWERDTKEPTKTTGSQNKKPPSTTENKTNADSLSVRLRKEGNGIYTSVTQGLCAAIKLSRLSKAANCYCRAFVAAAKDEESVPAAKNAARTYWKLAEAEIEYHSTASKSILQYREAFRYFSFAYNHGIPCNTSAWKTKLCSYIDSCWLDFRKTTDNHFDMENKIDLYYNVLQTVEIDYVRGNFYLNLARIHFRNGVTAIQNGQYQRGLSEMNNCSMPIHEARKKCLDAKNVGLECDTLEDDVIMHKCTADAMQAIDVGDKLFELVIKEDEKVNMEMVWDVVDWYKVAVLRTRERTEMELEAIAASRLGKIYDKVLKMKDKAKDYVMQSIQLAHSMHPRTFNSEDWFIDASAILKKYQDEAKVQDDAEWNKNREEVKKGMTEQLDELEKADKKRDLEFLDYVYKKFPPKNPMHKKLFVLPTDTSDIDHSKKKKLYQKAVVNYHPDRANVEENGVQWKVMTEEITKRFNCRYNRMKNE